MADFNLDFVGPGARLALAAAKRAEQATGDVGAAVEAVQAIVDTIPATVEAEAQPYVDQAAASAADAAAQVGDLKTTPTQRIGRPGALANSTTAIGAGSTIRQDTAATKASTVSKIGYRATRTANVKFRVLSSTDAVVGTVSKAVVAGDNVFDAASLGLPQVPVGGRVSVWSDVASLAYRQGWTADGAGYSTYAGDYAGTGAFTKNTNIRQLQWYVELTTPAETVPTATAFTALKSEADDSAAVADGLKVDVAERAGLPGLPVASGAALAGTNVFIMGEQFQTGGPLFADLEVAVVGDIPICLYTQASGAWTLIQQVVFTATATGVQTIDTGMTAQPGQYVGVIPNGCLGCITGTAMPSLGYYNFAPNTSGGGTDSSLSTATTLNFRARTTKRVSQVTAARMTTLEGNVVTTQAASAANTADLNKLKADVSEVAGLPSVPVAGGVALPGAAVFVLAEPYKYGGALQLDLEVVALATMTFRRYSKSGSNFTAMQTVTWTPTATGVQAVLPGLTMQPDELFGFVPNGALGYVVGAAMPSAGYYNFTPNGSGGGSDSTTSTASTLNIRATTSTNAVVVTAERFQDLEDSIGVGVGAQAFSYDATTGSAILAASEKTTYMIVGLGQSLSMGTNPDTTVAITTAAEYPGYGLMVNSGVWPNGAAITSLVDLVEGPTSVGGETHAAGTVSAILSRLYARHGRTPRLVYAIAGKGGTAYLGLKRGSDTYAELLRVVKAVNDIEVGAGRKLVVICTHLHHGEQDYRDGTTEAQYRRMLDWWQSNPQEDIRRITGQTAPVPMYAYQSNRGGRTVGIPSPPALAQLSIEKRNPLIRCLGPIYDSVAASDNAHVTGRSYRRMGRREGAMIADDLFATPTANSESLHIIASYWSATNKFCLQYNKPITIESTDTLVTVSTLGAGKGIDYTDNSGSVPTITGIAVTGTDTVEVTLSAAPTGLRKRCWIAARGQYPTGNTSGTGNVLGPRSGIRSTAVADTDPNDPDPIYHWACQEEVVL